MSQENVEAVRRFVEMLDRFMAALRANPGPVSETPFVDEFFDTLDPEVEWAWPLDNRVFRGREEMLQAATDFLEAVDDWRVEVDEIVDAADNRVFVAERVLARGKESGTPFEQHVFQALTVRDGKVWRIRDFVERSDALEAVALAE
jgi:ketosteroid isomerase-like protein